MVLLIVMIVAPLGVSAQTDLPDTLQVSEHGRIFAADSISTAPQAAFTGAGNSVSEKTPADSTSSMPLAVTETDKKMLRAQREHKIFTPDPQRALWLSFVIPGGGQIYNRKYWKLPIFYGGFLGCMYAFTWNQQMYMDYSQAYLDIMDDNPDTHSYLNMFPSSYEIDKNVSRYQTLFKNRKDRFRRYRDLSAFCFIGVYLLSVIDAYVDAQLSVFDISPDLSLQVTPTVLDSPNSRFGSYGFGATFNF